MKARFLIILALLAAPIARAQFGGFNLSKGLDTLKDVGKVAQSAAKIGPEREKDIGDSVALEIVGRYGGLVRNEKIMERVNLIGRSLGRYSSRPELDWRFGVLNSDTINAFSAPDGYVFITRGLYDLAASDDALAGILGHEVAHITLRHALTIVERAEMVSGATGIATKYNSKAAELEATAKQFDLGIEKVITAIFEKGFDPQTEYEADKEGRALAVTTGYASGGLRGVLTQLEKRGGDSKKVFSTHPPLKERIKRLPD